jgi:hypothetical protein
LSDERTCRIRRGKEGLLKEATAKPERCQVRSETDLPCQRPAVVEIGGVPFCGPCAREQEAYFAIGELTDYHPRGLDSDGPLVGVLNRAWRIGRPRAPGYNKPDAA